MPDAAPDPQSWQFLYRSDAGRIGAATWWRGTLVLAAILGVLTLGYVLVRPFSEHDLNKMPFLSLSVFAANLYIVLYVFAVILIGICYYNLTAKRLRDRGRAPALAGLLPFLALLSGALSWLNEQAAAALPPAVSIIVDIGLVLALVWNIVDLGGVLPASRRRG